MVPSGYAFILRESDSTHWELNFDDTLRSLASSTALFLKALERVTSVGMTKIPDDLMSATSFEVADRSKNKWPRQSTPAAIAFSVASAVVM